MPENVHVQERISYGSDFISSFKTNVNTISKKVRKQIFAHRIWKPRNKERHTLLALIYKKDISFRNIVTTNEITQFELLDCIIKVNTLSTRVVVVYRPPSCKNGLRYEDLAVEWASYIEQFVEVQEFNSNSTCEIFYTSDGTHTRLSY